MTGLRALAAADGRAALDMLYRKPVDIMLLDMKMPIMSGGEDMAELMTAYSGLRSSSSWRTPCLTCYRIRSAV